VNSTTKSSGFRQIATKEIALLSGLLFVGLVLVPIAVFFVGQAVFGTYGGVGYADFFATLSSKVRNGDFVAWVLILSPYLGWQCLRLTVVAWRLAGR
jgi:hypothetical protein